MPLQYLNGVVKFWGDVGDNIANEFEYSVMKGNAPQQLENTRDKIFGTDPNAVAAGKLVQSIADKTPIGVAEQGAAILGGNVAENSGGVHSLKYGATTNNLLGIEVVLMDGTITRFGGKVMDSEGYDFLGLMTGSEGLLGVITEVTVKILNFLAILAIPSRSAI